METYTVKRFLYQGEKVAILMQNKSGPCALLALANSLLLQKRLFINWNKTEISNKSLIEMIADELLVADSITRDDKNHEKFLEDAVEALPSLAQPLDLNVQFTSTNSFQYSKEQDIFDLLGVILVHGWIYAPCSKEGIVIGQKGYRELQDMLTQCKSLRKRTNLSREKLRMVAKGNIISSFLKESASQLTNHGLLSLHEDIQEGKAAVFFRNSQFSCIVKEQGQIYQLATDIGFKNRSTVIWEKLESIQGNNSFCDSSFKVTYSQNQPPKVFSQMRRKNKQKILLSLNLDFEQENNNKPQKQKSSRISYELRPPRPKHLPLERSKPLLKLVPQTEFKEANCVLM